VKKTPRAAAPALLAVAVVWGAAFVLMKPAIEQQPFYDFLASRFTLATLAMIIFRPRVIRELDWDLIKRGIPLGLLLGLGYITQTIALELTTAAITGFLTGLYVVLTPVLAFFIFKKRLDRRVLIGVVLAVIGLGLLSINGLTVEAGQLWGIACAIFFAAHIVALGAWSPGKNVYALTVLQLGTMAVINWVGAFVNDGSYQAPTNWDVWFAVIFTAVLATAVAFFVQTWAQSLMDASRVAIILTTEIVWAAAISVAAGQEVLSAKTIAGGLIMLAAMFIVEWPTKKGDPLAQTHFA
jgi:drug/metabolite transporter (DMT)-like permease